MNLSILTDAPEALIGLTMNDPLVQETLGIEEISADEDEEYGIWYSCLVDIGVEIRFDGDSKSSATITNIFFFVSTDAAEESSGEYVYSAFPTSLPCPYGLKRNFSENDVIELLGQPERQRGEIQSNLFGLLGKSFRYAVSPGKKLIVEFKNNRIDRLVVREWSK